MTGFVSKAVMGFMPKVMMGMMANDMKGEGSMMPQMMTKMMPHCLSTMLPAIQKEKRIDFVTNMVSILVEQGSSGMSDEERKAFLAKVTEKINI
ncbi:MAG: hypothetical protein ACE14P_05755 [Methanotrichaceae archaeon]